MQYTLILLLLPLALAAPLQRRALTLQSYNDLSISAGTAGNAASEALAKFPVDMSDLANVSADDLQTIQTERESAESAETEAFNPAIDAATGDAATALQNGKIKNKVLKCMCSHIPYAGVEEDEGLKCIAVTGEVLALQIQQAQGKDTADQITAEQKKLTNNINLDKAAAGQPSTAVDFSD